MKKTQCTGCGQIFWTDLQVDENLVGSGEWVQNPCPKCGALWAVIEPAGAVPLTKKGRKSKPGPKRRGRPRIPAQATREGAPVKEEEREQEISPKGIPKLRKKLGISQTKLGSLVGVGVGTVVSWEKGKFSPRKDKVAQLSALAKKGKEDVEKLIPKKEAKREREKPAESSLEKSVKGKGKKRAIAGVRGKKSGKTKRVERVARPRGKGIKSMEIAGKVGANPMPVARDLKEGKKE